jgi:1,4-alpha-glucan branching enzyme
MFAQPGKKLLFMGGEIAQWNEWRHDGSVDWHLARYDRHAGVRKLVSDLNALYRREPAMHGDCDPAGFAWIDCNDAAASVLSFLRRGAGSREVLCVCNFTPVVREGYGVWVPHGGVWRELLNTDAALYGGSGAGNMGDVEAGPHPSGHGGLLTLVLPPLSVLYMKPGDERT